MNGRINWIYRNLHLVVSVWIVVPTAIIYGSPSILLDHLDIRVNTIDQSNMLQAIMCLYIGVSTVWVLGICKAEYWKSATQLNVLSMLLSLAIGRVLSMILDGLPSDGYKLALLQKL